MNLRKWITPTVLLPSLLRRKLYGELWQKEQIHVELRDYEEAVAIKTRPLPYLEMLFRVTNHLPVPLHVYGAFVEIWMGKPVVQFHSFLSETLQKEETREGLRVYSFLNNYQSDLLNPPKKESLPPNLSIILTISCRSSLGLVEKTVRSTWTAPKIQ